MKPEITTTRSFNSPNSPMVESAALIKKESRDFNSSFPGYAPFNSTEYLTQNYYDLLNQQNNNDNYCSHDFSDQELNNYGSMFDLIKDGNNNSLFPAQIVPSL